MSAVQYVVALRSDDLARLNQISRGLAAEEKDWLRERRKQHRGLRGSDLAKARAKLRAELAAERAAGRLVGSRDLLLAQALRAELAGRGWDREWPAPETGAIGPGRRWGVEANRYAGQHDEDSDTGFKGRLALRLPAELGEQLRRACYWHCKEAVDKLQAWADRFGDGPEVILLEAQRSSETGAAPAVAGLSAALAHRPKAQDFRDRARLRKQIITTGDILRASVDRVLAAHADPVQIAIPLD